MFYNMPYVWHVGVVYHPSIWLQVLFRKPEWQGLNATQRLQYLEEGKCPGAPDSALHATCRNEWQHYLISYVQPWAPLEKQLDAVMEFVQTLA